MKPEIAEYFGEKYKAQDVRVVPGHWPDFKSKQEVDDWISFLQKLGEVFK